MKTALITFFIGISCIAPLLASEEQPSEKQPKYREVTPELQTLYKEWETIQYTNSDEEKREEVALKILEYWDAELNREYQDGLRSYPQAAKIYQQSQQEWLRFRDALLCIASHYKTWRYYISEEGERIKITHNWTQADTEALQAFLTFQRVMDLREIASHRDYTYLGNHDVTALTMRESEKMGELESFSHGKLEGAHSASFRDAMSLIAEFYEGECDTAIRMLYALSYIPDREENQEAIKERDQAFETLKSSARLIPVHNVNAIDEAGDFGGAGTMYLDVRSGYIQYCYKTQYNIVVSILFGEPLSFQVLYWD